MGSAPDRVNSQGSVLSYDDARTLAGTNDRYEYSGARGSDGRAVLDPTTRATMMLNWLTGGPQPKAIDPTQAFADSMASYGVRQQASMGMGMSGLFGFGDFSSGGANFNSPMAKGSPYTVPPIPKIGGS